MIFSLCEERKCIYKMSIAGLTGQTHYDQIKITLIKDQSMREEVTLGQLQKRNTHPGIFFLATFFGQRFIHLKESGEGYDYIPKSFCKKAYNEKTSIWFFKDEYEEKSYCIKIFHNNYIGWFSEILVLAQIRKIYPNPELQGFPLLLAVCKDALLFPWYQEIYSIKPEQLPLLKKQLLSVISKLNSLHIFHRDIKPGNVMMFEDGFLLIDYDLADVVADGTLIIANDEVGTPGFVAPKKIISEVNVVTISEQIWAVGITLHCLREKISSVCNREKKETYEEQIKQFLQNLPADHPEYDLLKVECTFEKGLIPLSPEYYTVDLSYNQLLKIIKKHQELPIVIAAIAFTSSLEGTLDQRLTVSLRLATMIFNLEGLLDVCEILQLLPKVLEKFTLSFPQIPFFLLAEKYPGCKTFRFPALLLATKGFSSKKEVEWLEEKFIPPSESKNSSQTVNSSKDVDYFKEIEEKYQTILTEFNLSPSFTFEDLKIDSQLLEKRKNQ